MPYTPNRGMKQPAPQVQKSSHPMKRRPPTAPKKKDMQVGAMVKLLGGSNSPFVGEGRNVK